MNKAIKDWKIAQLMFGKNGKVECKIVKTLRKYGIVEPLCSTWSTITDKREENICGWLIPNECLNQ